MCVDFGSHLDHLFDEMYQMNTRISRIARCQSHLGGFAPSPWWFRALTLVVLRPHLILLRSPLLVEMMMILMVLALSDAPFVTCDKKVE